MHESENEMKSDIIGAGGKAQNGERRRSETHGTDIRELCAADGGRVERESNPGVTKRAGSPEASDARDKDRRQDGMGHGRRGRCFVKEGDGTNLVRYYRIGSKANEWHTHTKRSKRREYRRPAGRGGGPTEGGVSRGRKTASQENVSHGAETTQVSVAMRPDMDARLPVKNGGCSESQSKGVVEPPVEENDRRREDRCRVMVTPVLNAHVLTL
ncbi:hypothetical protein DFH08DRAFT_819152 [Mycena albidolilacea]|uniref:Uncharacterized protein n=1 Tax=Mycena albidolilacea TaxID=1033008 RepID=A0AAD6ZFD8_9AGAR|nr:hypothetical protein DFH08DRAFT_819152 [Mycena albidolilacea]